MHYVSPSSLTSGKMAKRCPGGGSRSSVPLPPGIAPGGEECFAVMDPTSCPCNEQNVVRRGTDRTPGDSGRLNACGNKESGGVIDGEARGEGMEDIAVSENVAPPCLWPNGALLGNSQGSGPMRHDLRLRSAYAQQGNAWGTGEPAFTSYHKQFKVCKCAKSTYLEPFPMKLMLSPRLLAA